MLSCIAIKRSLQPVCPFGPMESFLETRFRFRCPCPCERCDKLMLKVV